MGPIALRRKSQGRGQGLVLSGTAPVDGAVAPDLNGAGEPLAEAVVEQRRIGEILVERGAASSEHIDEAALAQSEGEEGVRMGELLVKRGIISEAELAAALSAQLNLPLVDLRREAVDPEVAALLAETVAREVLALPIRRTDQGVLVAVSDPHLPNLRARLGDSVGEAVVVGVAARDDIASFIDRTYRSVGEIDQFVKAFEARTPATGAAERVQAERVDENAPVVQVVSRLLSQGVRDRASDIHIEPMGDRVRVRNRIDGALHEVLSLPQSMAQALSSRIKIMAGLNIVERRRPQDGQIEATVDGRDLDVRVSTTGTVFGEKVVLRLLDRQRALYDLGELGMPPETLEVYNRVIRSPYGMVVCAGPTGSGKTTTLYATLSSIQSDEINVMTVEDPVEYVFPAINQISINEQAGVTFAGGLRAILRQDPDSILIGEIRDVETARIAVQAALTGHFVMSTIHATDAASALHRFLDMGIESFLLASAMLAVVGQRLVRRSCAECAEPYTPTAEELAFYQRATGHEPPADVKLLKGSGCTFCSNTGYLGRVGVYEVLQITDEVRELLVQNATLDDMRRSALDTGMIPMQRQAMNLVDRGATTIAEVMRTVYVL